MTPKSNEEIWMDRGERYGNSFTNHPILWILAVIVTVVILSTVGNFACGWFNAGKDIISPANVKAQYHAVIEDYQSLQAEAANVCQAKDAQQNSNSPTFLEDPAFAYAAKYRQTAVDYNERQNNFFEAKEVGPKGYPSTAPTLEEMQAQVC